MHFIIQSGFVECPACGTFLEKKRDQDKRVSIMQHSPTKFCSMHDKLYRVDRLNGNAEELHEA